MEKVNLKLLLTICSTVPTILTGLPEHYKNIDMSILQQSDSKFTSVLLFDDTSFGNNKNTFILDATIDYIISTGRFDVPLFSSSWLAFVSLAFKWNPVFDIATNSHLGLFVFIFSTRFFLLHVWSYCPFFTFFVYNCFSQAYQYLYTPGDCGFMLLCKCLI